AAARPQVGIAAARPQVGDRRGPSAGRGSPRPVRRSGIAAARPQSGIAAAQAAIRLAIPDRMCITS
ncbi:MAG: hypothetical protein ACLQID_10685, partial [Streptosporangiaceae bacterium]